MAENKTCSRSWLFKGFKSYMHGIEKCEASCKGKSSLFTYGIDRWNKKFMCICETEATADGRCSLKDQTGVELYEYTGKMPSDSKE